MQNVAQYPPSSPCQTVHINCGALQGTLVITNHGTGGIDRAAPMHQKLLLLLPHQSAHSRKSKSRAGSSAQLDAILDEKLAISYKRR